jgi:4-amino-4-deoxy-L-arabinose transferase-like glycosyltransferase
MMMWRDIPKTGKIITGLVMALCLYFVFFQQLGSYHIRTWDESTYAVNAFEMHQNGNYLTPYMKGVPDFEWNTKPPMMLWLQVFFIKLMGFNELSVRLPSAIAGSLTALFLFFFTARRLSFLLASSVFLTFITCMGISDFHAARTGDLDALLLLFISLSAGSYYIWLETENHKYLTRFFIFLTLAYLTKSIAAFLFVPSLFVITLMQGKLKQILNTRAFYEGLFFLATVITTYVMFRENEGPYINGLFANEFNRVYELKDHVQPADYYLNALFEGHFFWIWPAIPGIILALRDEGTRRFSTFLLICLVGHFFVISYASVKYIWYMLPDMLILSWFAGFAVYRMVLMIQPDKALWNQLFYLVLVLSLPYYFAARQSYKSEIPEQQRKDESLVNYVFKHKKEFKLHKHYLISTHFNLPLYAYKYMYHEKGWDFEIRSDVNNLPVKALVAISEAELEEQLKQNYELYLVEEQGMVKRYFIKAKRK